MTTLLETAFEKISALPEIEQNIYAKNILDEIESEKKLDSSFSESEQEILNDISNISAAVSNADNGIGHKISLKINL